MSELAYRLLLQKRALARDRLFLDDSMNQRAYKFHFDCARRLASQIIASHS